jgi:hypothetical protein
MRNFYQIIAIFFSLSLFVNANQNTALRYAQLTLADTGKIQINIDHDTAKAAQSDLVASAAVTNSAYAKNILKKYVNAIGTEELLRSVDDRIIDMKGTVEGVETEIMFYQKVPNKLCQEIFVGEVEQKIIFDGMHGVKIIGDMGQEITGDELIKLSFDSIMDLVLDPESYGVKLEYDGLEQIDDKNMYKILLTLPNGSEWFQYYDMETGFKVRDSRDIITPQGKFKQITIFDDYRSVDGILYPFKIKQYLGNQTLDFTVVSIKVNTGISDDIFKIE